MREIGLRGLVLLVCVSDENNDRHHHHHRPARVEGEQVNERANERVGEKCTPTMTSKDERHREREKK